MFKPRNTPLRPASGKHPHSIIQINVFKLCVNFVMTQQLLQGFVIKYKELENDTCNLCTTYSARIKP